jgi:integrase
VKLPQYLKRSPMTGTFSFRIAVPLNLREAAGKRELKKALKTDSPSKALAMAMRLHDDAKALFEKLQSTAAEATPQALYEAANAWAANQGFDPTQPISRNPDDGMAIARDMVADTLSESVKAGKATAFDEFKLDALRGDLKRPVPTFRDAVTLYLKERNDPKMRTTTEHNIFEQMVRRYENYLLASLKKDKPLTEFTRKDGRDFRDFLQAPMVPGDGEKSKALKPASVDKAIRIIRAIFNHAVLEWELNIPNPFAKLTVLDHVSAKDKRRSFTPEELTQYLVAAEGMNDEAKHCTILMAFTGARTAEITGLEIDDVRLDAPIPHLILRPNSTRPSLKTGGISKRVIPLLGDGLIAAQQAIAKADMTKPKTPLFTRYGKPRGEDVLSALQNKLIRKKLKIADPKLTAYSTRHLMKDRLRNALVAPDLQDAIMGHSKGQTSEGYGDGFWLPKLKDALTSAVT